MGNFIEVTDYGSGTKILINTNWIEQIYEEGDTRCIIYFGFNTPSAVEQDYVLVNESYYSLRNRILSGQIQKGN